MPHVHCGSIIGYIEKRCASAADERRRPSRFCPRYVSAVSEARFHDKVGGEAGDVARDRYSREKEAARGCGGRGLWKVNRFSPGNRCQKRNAAKTLLLMLIDVVVLAFIWIIVARGGLLFKTTVQTTVSNACISHALASAARAASFSRAIRNL